MSPITFVCGCAAVLFAGLTLVADPFGEVVRYGMLAIVFALLAVAGERRAHR